MMLRHELILFLPTGEISTRFRMPSGVDRIGFGGGENLNLIIYFTIEISSVDPNEKIAFVKPRF